MQYYIDRVDDLFSSTALITSEEFEGYMMHLLEGEFDDRKRCFEIVLVLTECSLKPTYGTRFVWLFSRFILSKFPDLGVSIIEFYL